MRVLALCLLVGGCTYDPVTLCPDGFHQGVLLCIPDAPPDLEEPPDMTPPDDLAPPPPDMAPPPVTGTRIDRQITESGATVSDFPYDLTMSGDLFEAFAPSRIAGVGKNDGTFYVPGVPMAPYVLHWSGPSARSWLFTSARSFDFGFTFVQRADANFASAGTTLALSSVGGLTPWAAGDELEYVSATAGVQLHLYATQLSGIANGATALTRNETWDGNGRVQASRGDLLYLSQLVPTASSNGVSVLTLTKTARIAGLEMRDAATTTVGTGGVAAAFTAPPTVTAALDLRLSQFAAFTFGPGTPANNPSVVVEAVPGGPVTAADSAPTLASFSPANFADVDVGTLAIGNPFPSSYTLQLSVSGEQDFAFTAPGATTPAAVAGGIFCSAKLATWASGPIVPLVGPPAYPKINGVNLVTVAAPVTTTPTLTWKRPIGSVSWYQVSVVHVTKSGTATVLTTAASLSTADTTLTLPSGILVPGEKYVLALRSVYRPNGDLTRPQRTSVPDCVAGVVSAMLSP